jgi:hypothetical protein
MMFELRNQELLWKLLLADVFLRGTVVIKKHHEARSLLKSVQSEEDVTLCTRVGIHRRFGRIH